MDSKYTPIVGLEIHVELKTKSKMFCGCKNDPFHAPKPNIFTCPVCLGLPGALPVPNLKAVEWTAMLGLALGCEILSQSKFDRKNYFYPDLPKGYQISQYDEPIARGGELKFTVGSSQFAVEKTVRINRVHLEEDTGKLIHSTINGKKVSLIDFNRSGVPLVEIVTEPDIHSSEEAKIFLKKLYQIVRYLNISDADMEKGSMRLEPNISVQEVHSSQFTVHSNKELPNYKVEVKNINSFNFVKKAIDYEVERHIKILESGEVPRQETRGWEEKKGITLPQRSKEEAHDYRYFPEPDIPPMEFTSSQITNFKSQIPELPDAKFNRFLADYNLTHDQAMRLIDTVELAVFYEACVQYALKQGLKSVGPKTIANWLINKQVDIKSIRPDELLNQIQATKVSIPIDEKELESIIKKVLDDNPKAVSDYKSGKTNVMMFLVGMVMKESKGKSDAKKVKIIIEKLIKTK